MEKKGVNKFILTFIIGVYAVISLYPLVWMMFQSLKSDMEFYLNQYSIPLHPKWVNYISAWKNASFAVYYKNSIIVTAISIAVIIVACSLASYAFVKVNFAGKKVFMFLLVVVLFLPSPMLLFPVYMIARSLGILNTYAGLIGPYVCGSVPISILIMNNAFESIPRDIGESAKIDGCSEYAIWWKIMMPLVKSSIATISIIAFIGIWNEYMWALISITNKDLFTLPYGIAYIASKIYSYGYGTVFAGMVMTTVPVILLYIGLQEQFVKAVTAGAVKG